MIQGTLMADCGSLQLLREQRFFESWDEFISPVHVEASEANVRGLVDDLIALGPKPTEAAARCAVDECVRRFNARDDAWICTTEREDIYEQIGRVVDACGFDCQEDWLDEREW
jgi:hypothetical protein